MRKLKKVIKYIVIIILTIEIISLISTPKEIKKFQSASDEEREEMLEKEYEDFLDGTKYVEDYYDTIEEAIDNSDNSDIKKIYKVLKEIEIDDNYIIIGPATMKDGTEEFVITRLKTKITSNGKKKYSNIVTSDMYEGLHSMKDGNHEFIAYINYIFSNIKKSHYTSTIILKKYPNFRWSFGDAEEIKYLEIRGKKPDEVIPFDMRGKTLYFYYYEDLKIEGEIKEEDFVINKDGERK